MATQKTPQDKQLRDIRLVEVLEKRQLDQALNAKEFAVLTGVSYSTARAWFRLLGFPVINGVVFWADFVEWRRTRTGLGRPTEQVVGGEPVQESRSLSQLEKQLSSRAARILSEAG
jgi:hypothetical protein